MAPNAVAAIENPGCEVALLDLSHLGAWTVRPIQGSDVRYEPLQEEGRRFVRATSVKAAAFYQRHVSFDVRRSPWLEWDWRVLEAVSGEDLGGKRGNDCSARLVLGFRGDWSKAGFLEGRAAAEEVRKTGYEPPGTLLVYAWSSTRAEGEILDDPHLGSRARVLLASTAPGRDPTWRRVRRHVFDDYRRAFGSDPPEVVFVALLSDSDDTCSRAVADYGDVRILSDLPAPNGSRREGKIPVGPPPILAGLSSGEGPVGAWGLVAALALALSMTVGGLLIRRRRWRVPSRRPDAP